MIMRQILNPCTKSGKYDILCGTLEYLMSDQEYIPVMQIDGTQLIHQLHYLITIGIIKLPGDEFSSGNWTVENRTIDNLQHL